MFLEQRANEYGTPVGAYRCDTCNGEYTVCPAPEDHSEWQNCLAKECASYTPGRDADRLFDEGNVLSFEARAGRVVRRAASVDTHAKRGDSPQSEAPSPMGSAVLAEERGDAHD